MPRLRLLPFVLVLFATLVVVKVGRVLDAWPDMAALAQTPPAPTPAAAPAAPLARAPPSAEAVAERAVLEALRARRAELEAREAHAAAREQVLAAAERRLMQRIEDLGALQTRLEALERDRVAREESGLRGLVKLYEGMRPRDAATIFDELDLPVLVAIVDRMREAKAAPVMGAMRPDRARVLTAELAKLRAERLAQDRMAAAR
jgi:flagellar motility protein MotE (MotC chaperone)